MFLARRNKKHIISESIQINLGPVDMSIQPLLINTLKKVNRLRGKGQINQKHEKQVQHTKRSGRKHWKTKSSKQVKSIQLAVLGTFT